MANKHWIGASGSLWTADSSWSDATPATIADTVTVTGPASSYAIVTGPGAASSLALLGLTTLRGAFSLGSLAVGASGSVAGLNVAAGTTVAANSASILDGKVLVAGTGARLAVGGALTIGAAPTPFDYTFVSNTLAVSGAGLVQAGSVVLQASPLVTNAITIDATSSLEVGSTGGATAGKLTIDAGHLLSGAGTITAAAGVLNQGTVTAQNGTLRITGAIGGAGRLQIGAAGTLDLSSATADTDAIAFAAPAATLLVGGAICQQGSQQGSQQGAISGFVQGDTIGYVGNATVTSAVYQAAPAGNLGTGTLTLKSGSTTLGSLGLVGNFTGYSFQVTPGAASFQSNITLITTPAAMGPASAGTATPDAYAWTLGGSGAWGVAANWKDITTRTTAAIAPGINDFVTLAGLGGTAYQVVTGPGNAAALALVGNTTLRGTFGIGDLVVGGTSVAGALCIAAGSVVNAATATLLDGPILLTGAGATLNVAGALTLGAPPTAFDYAFVSNTLTLSGAAAIQADSLVLVAGPLITNAITIDASSTLEVGEAGGAASGKLTIDAGKLLVGSGSIRAANGILDQGAILVQAGTLRIAGPVTGTGQVQVGAGGTLDLSGTTSIDTAAVTFTSTTGTLLVGSSGGQLTQRGTIGGFLLGDTIAYVDPVNPLTDVVYQAGAAGLGTLTLKSGPVSLGTLSIAGDYAGYSFQVTPGATANAYAITLAADATGSVSPGTATPDVYIWTGAVGTNWSTAANWFDVSTGMVATVAPGAHNSVTLGAQTSGARQASVMANPAMTRGLSLSSGAVLNGTYHTGALAVSGSAAAPLSSGITATPTSVAQIAANSAVSAGSASVVASLLQVAGNGAQLAIVGTLTLGSGVSGLVVGAGGIVQAGSVALTGGSITIDAASVVEVGSSGNAAAGCLTVDAGAMLSGSGTVIATAGLMDRGTIQAQGTLSVSGAVSGSGTLEITRGSTLNLVGTASSKAAILFDGLVSGTANTGTLCVRSSGPASLNAQGLISGFLLGDTIAYSGTSPAGALAGVSYQAAGDNTGTLTLNGASGVIGTLRLVGNFSGYGFQFAPGPVAGTQGITLAITDPLFDAAYYLQQNPDVAAAGIDPYWHFMNVGWHEGRNPDACFDTKYYLSSNPDLAAAAGMSQVGYNSTFNPLTHFETVGWTECRQPSLAFSDSAYLAANPDVKAAGANPLVHWLEIGHSEGRTTGLPGFDGNLAAADPMVNAAYVDAQRGATIVPAGAAGQAQAAEFYAATGWQAGVNPDAWFDTSFYLAQNPDVKAAGIDPLLHYETQGWLENRDPSLLFSTSKYLAASPDVKAANMDPLLHYIDIGQQEGRMAFLSGPTASADPLVDAAYYDKQLGATLIPTGNAAAGQAAANYASAGWKAGLNPDAWFDTNYYLSHNPDIAAAHIDPLTHYENQGWLEGRDPSAAFSTNKYLAAYKDVAAEHVDPLAQFLSAGPGSSYHTFAV